MRRLRSHCLPVAFALACALTAPQAAATFHTYQIQEIFSNADGTIQYVVLREALGMDGQNLLAGHTFTASRAARPRPTRSRPICPA